MSLLSEKLFVRAGRRSPHIQPSAISIGITTFKARFHAYFVPLLNRLREYCQNEIIVAVNGEHNIPFDEDYRREMLHQLASHPNVFPVFFPHFRGLAKLWNTIVIHATHDHILILNDDIMIHRADFLDEICRALQATTGRMFVINGSWSHFLATRAEIDELGYFDERLLGIGEEDGDMTWRYIQRYGHPVPSVKICAFQNLAADTTDTYRPPNIQTHSGTKYSLFNRNFILREKYEPSPAGIRGMFDQPMQVKSPAKEQYPYERFYRDRRSEL